MTQAYATDIDFVEWRSGRGIVALISVTGEMIDEAHMESCKKFIWERTEIEREILCTLAKSAGVPVYYVLHTSDMKTFHVYTLLDSNWRTTYERMDADMYRRFVEAL